MQPARAARRLHLLAVVLAGLLLVGGCAGSPSSDGAGSSTADVGAASAPEESVSGSLADEGGAPGDAARAAPMERAIVSTGDVQLTSPDVARARAEVVRLTAGWGGTVADEESTSDADGRAAYTTMTLRVPSERFAAAMDALAQVADLGGQSRTEEDVTTQVVDVSARVRVQQASVRRVEALLAEAQDLRDVLAIESDLAQRQADLDSLRSQQAYLADQTSLSTITVAIDRATGARPDDDGSGFLAGLGSGWDALGSATTGLLTAAGAVLPFAVLVGLLALLALPLLRVVRRRRARAA